MAETSCFCDIRILISFSGKSPTRSSGPFAAIEDIMNVQGIKEGTFAKIKDEIVVG